MSVQNIREALDLEQMKNFSNCFCLIFLKSKTTTAVKYIRAFSVRIQNEAEFKNPQNEKALQPHRYFFYVI